MIYDWGYYPTETINYCNGFKAKANFDDIKIPELTEVLLDRLVKLAQENLGSLTSKPFFKLMGSQKFQNVRSKKLIKDIIMVCINSMGRHISLDKIAYIILIKCSLKISEGIKEHKPAISDAVIKSIFLMFKQFDRPDFCDQREYMKVYLYYLKLLVTLGKEVASQGDP